MIKRYNPSSAGDFVGLREAKQGRCMLYTDVSAKAMQIIEFMVNAEQTGRNFEDCLEAWNKVQEMLEDFIK